MSEATSVVGRSMTAVFLPIIAALKKADAILGENRIWEAVNEQQKKLLELYRQVSGEVLDLPFLEAIANLDVKVINDWLRSRGWTIQLTPLPETRELKPFYTASILDLMVEWAKRGTQATVKYQEQEYPAFRLGKSDRRFLGVENHLHPIVALLTKSSIEIYVTILEQPPADEFALFQLAQDFQSGMRIAASHYGGVKLPWSNWASKSTSPG